MNNNSINYMEIYVLSPCNMSGAILKKVVFEAVKGIEIHAQFSQVTFKKVKNGYTKITALYNSGDNVCPQKIMKLKHLQILNNSSEELLFEDVKGCTVIGEDQNGYSIGRLVSIPDDAPYLLEKGSHERHLVVSGIHGNFKKRYEAIERASHYKDAKVIRIVS